MRRHVFFLVRYSILTDRESGWKLARRPRDEYARALYSDERLSFRARLFETLTAPSIARNASSTDVPCSTLILTSKELPSPARQRLESVAATIPHAEVITLAKGAAYPERPMRKEIAKRLARLGDETLFATVQIDDDDVLSPDYLSMLRRYVEPAFRGHAVSFARDYVGEWSRREQAFECFRHLYAPKIFLGLAYVNSFDARTQSFHDPDAVTVYGMGRHQAIDEKRPVIVIARAPAWIRTFHHENDTHYARSGGGSDAPRGGDEHWHRWLAVAPADEVLAEFPAPELPLTESAERQRGEAVRGKVRFQTEALALRRMPSRGDVPPRARLITRIVGRLRRLASARYRRDLER